MPLTQPYTPSASWHETTVYQPNGAKSDGLSLIQAGLYALDNVAYLTGANTSSAVNRLATVANLAALKAITGQRNEDYTTAKGLGLYQFDSSSALAPDNLLVVAPDVGTGRWLMRAGLPSGGGGGALRRMLPGSVFAPAQDVDNYIGTTWAYSQKAVAWPSKFHFVAHSNDFLAGDVITSLDFREDCTPYARVTLTAYHVRSTSGTSAPTVTNLGNRTATGTLTLSPTITWAEGDCLVFDAYLDPTLPGSGPGTTEAILTFVAINATR